MHRRRRRSSSSSAPTVNYVKSQVLWEQRNYGTQYIQNKYGMAVYDKLKSYIDQSNTSSGRSTETSDGKRVNVRMGDGFQMRLIGDASKNAAPKARDGFKAEAGRFRDGGPSDQAYAHANENAAFKRKLQLNLDNDEELAQGQQHPWAQSSSISSLITGQLRQAQTSAADYWDQWAADKGGQTNLLARSSSPFGVDASYTPPSDNSQYSVTGASEQLANTNSMGAFGTNSVMYGLNDPQYAEAPLPNATTGVQEPDLFPGEKGAYNPWARGSGGELNQFGPNPQALANSTMEAMQLANAYFAPQRMELAYELGDMETDMRRLAVNLGRQVDDPVLQAKLYKEGMRAVRTMDVQQNTLAFQMGESRRKEEIQNFQFYDQLAQEEYRLRLANRQFYENLDLQKRYYNLQNYQVGNAPAPTTTITSGSAPSTGANGAASEDRSYISSYNPYGKMY